MKAKIMFNLLLGVGLVLGLGIGLVSSSNRALAQDATVQGDMSAQGAVGTAFTYQGRLVKNGSPVAGACDFQFSLWTAANGGSQAGSTLTKSSVALDAGGNFSVPLDFGGSAFQGDARYLRIAVRCPAGSGSYTALSGRVELTAAPYAHSLRPGAKMSGNATSGSILQAISSATSGDPAGLYGEANSSNGAGVAGWNLANSGGYAVYGNNTASSGVPYGVYGIASDNGSATSYGVYGKSSSSVGIGVGGSAPTNGVYGEATNSSGAAWGVYGKSSSPSGYGVYSNGDAHVEGNLTWKAKRSVISIPTSAFIPEQLNDAGNVPYDNEGYYLKNESSTDEWYTAPVQLPHGAVIKQLNAGWHDGSDRTAGLMLRRRSLTDLTSSLDAMAQVDSRGSVHGIIDGLWSDDTIDFATVDNEHYTYYLETPLPASAEDIKLLGVTIVYEISQPY